MMIFTVFTFYFVFFCMQISTCVFEGVFKGAFSIHPQESGLTVFQATVLQVHIFQTYLEGVKYSISPQCQQLFFRCSQSHTDGAPSKFEALL